MFQEGSLALIRTNSGPEVVTVTRRWAAFTAIAGVLLLTSCAPAEAQSESTLTVFAAASLIKSFDQMSAAFEQQHPEVDVQLSYASSSTLATQIAAGAPADVLATADPESMTTIEGLTASAPLNFATNTLTVAVPPGNPGQVTGIKDLSRRELLVGLCDPSAPCGRLAVKTLAANGVTADVDTFEANNQALFTRLQQGELDAALIYRSDAHTANGTVISFPAPDHTPVDTYQIAALRMAPNQTTAQAFVDFTRSAEGQAILTANGLGQP